MTDTSPRVERPLAALVLSLALFALPIVGLTLGRKLFDQETGSTDTATGVITGAVLCVGVWLGYPALWRLRELLTRRAPAWQGPPVESPALLRAILAEHDLPCARCGYNLRGLAEPACPECHETVRLVIENRGASGPAPILVWLLSGTIVLHAAATSVSVYTMASSVVTYYTYAGLNGYPWWQLVPYGARAALDLTGITLVATGLIAWRRAGDFEARTAVRWRLVRRCIWVLAIDGTLTLAWWLWTVVLR